MLNKRVNRHDAADVSFHIWKSDQFPTTRIQQYT